MIEMKKLSESEVSGGEEGVSVRKDTELESGPVRVKNWTMVPLQNQDQSSAGDPFLLLRQCSCWEAGVSRKILRKYITSSNYVILT
jgi:hypothetical protein